MNNERRTLRTLAVSDPKWETDHLRHVTVKSENLRGRGDVTFFLPPQIAGKRDVPLVILLHGIFGSHWNWTRKGGVHRTALRMIETGSLPPLVIAMPSDGLRGDGTGYLPHREFDVERWIVDDIPEVTREVVADYTDASPLFIAGLSMGGFGAMRLGAKFGPRFNGISAHSAVTAAAQYVGLVENPPGETSIVPAEHDILDVMIAHRENLPPLRFDCGVDDPLVGHNRTLHEGLTTVEIAHLYEEFPGTHDWSYWEAHIKDTLEFFSELLS